MDGEIPLTPERRPSGLFVPRDSNHGLKAKKPRIILGTDVPEGFVRTGQVLMPLQKPEAKGLILDPNGLTSEERESVKVPERDTREEMLSKWRDVAPSGGRSIVGTAVDASGKESFAPMQAMLRRFLDHLQTVVPQGALDEWSLDSVTKLLTHEHGREFSEKMRFKLSREGKHDPGASLLDEWTGFMRVFSGELETNTELKSNLFRIGFLLHKFGSVVMRKEEKETERPIVSEECLSLCVEEVERAKKDRNRIRSMPYAHALGILRLRRNDMTQEARMKIVSTLADIPDLSNDFAETLLSELRTADRSKKYIQETITRVGASIEAREARLKKIGSLPVEQFSKLLEDPDPLAVDALGIPPSRNPSIDTKVGLELEMLSPRRAGTFPGDVRSRLTALRAGKDRVWQMTNTMGVKGAHKDQDMTEIITPDPGLLLTAELFKGWIDTADFLHDDQGLYFLRACHVNIDPKGRSLQSSLTVKGTHRNRWEINMPSPSVFQNAPYLSDLNRISDQAAVADFAAGISDHAVNEFLEANIYQGIKSEQEIKARLFELLEEGRKFDFRFLATAAHERALLPLLPAILRLYAKDALPPLRLRLDLMKRLLKHGEPTLEDVRVIFKDALLTERQKDILFGYLPRFGWSEQAASVLSDETISENLRAGLASLLKPDMPWSDSLNAFLCNNNVDKSVRMRAAARCAPSSFEEVAEFLKNPAVDDRIRVHIAERLTDILWSPQVRDLIIHDAPEISSGIRRELAERIATIPWGSDILKILSDETINSKILEALASRLSDVPWNKETLELCSSKYGLHSEIVTTIIKRFGQIPWVYAEGTDDEIRMSSVLSDPRTYSQSARNALTMRTWPEWSSDVAAFLRRDDVLSEDRKNISKRVKLPGDDDEKGSREVREFQLDENIPFSIRQNLGWHT